MTIFFTSCSSMEDERKSLRSSGLATKDDAELVKTFSLSEEEQKQYKIATNEITTPEKVPEKKAKKTSTTTPKIVTKTIATNPLPVVSDYPPNFPEDLKRYDEKSANLQKIFKPIYLVNEESVFEISYLGISSGFVTMNTLPIKQIGGADVYHYFARFKSLDRYRYFYWLNDTIESYLSKKTFLPFRYTLLQREKIQNVDDLQLFDFNTLKANSFYKRVKENANKDEKLSNFIPKFAQDSFSALQYVRGLPLNTGDLYEFPVLTRGNVWLLKLEVMGDDEIEVMDKKIKAIKIKAETHFPGVLQKSGDIIFWYEKSPERRLLKFKAKVKLGSINGDLVEYRHGQ